MQEAAAKPGNQWLIIGSLSLVATVLAPVLALIRTTLSMKNSFGALGNEGLSSGVGELSGHIGEVLVATAVGGIVSIICLPVGIYCLIKHSRIQKQRREAQLPQSPVI